MPFNIFGVLEEIKNEYDVNTEERKALSIIEKKLCENKKLKEQLEIAVEALKTAINLACPYGKSLNDMFDSMKDIQKSVVLHCNR